MPTRAVLAAAALAVSAAGCMGTGTRRVDAACREMRSVVVYEMLRDNPSVVLVDLREPSEVTAREGRIRGALEIPLAHLPEEMKNLQKAREGTVIVFGREGDAGRRACQLLSSHGFRYVIFIADGAAGWFRNGLPSAPAGEAATSHVALR